MSEYLNLKPVEFSAMGAKNRAAFQWEGRILLPKYDGCFAMVGFFNGEPFRIWSRTGEEVKSMGHIYEDLLKVYPWLADKDKGWMVLGEAWNPGKEFSDLSGEFRRQYPQPQLGFAPFDLVQFVMVNGVPRLSSATPYTFRLSPLTDARKVEAKVYVPVPVVCDSRDHAERYARYLKDLGGYDGAICGDATAGYTPGAGKGGEFIKLKPLLSYSLEVVGFERDHGEKTGRPTGALVVRFKEGKTCKVATGMTEAQQANLAQFMHTIIEVEAMGITSGGLLREPRFKGVRSDAKADY